MRSIPAAANGITGPRCCRCQVVLASLKVDAGLIGAAALGRPEIERPGKIGNCHMKFKTPSAGQLKHPADGVFSNGVIDKACALWRICQSLSEALDNLLIHGFHNHTAMRTVASEIIIEVIP